CWAADESAKVFKEIDTAITVCGFSEKHPGEQKPGHCQEYIDTTRDTTIAKQMEQDHTEEGEPAYAMKLWQITALWEDLCKFCRLILWSCLCSHGTFAGHSITSVKSVTSLPQRL